MKAANIPMKERLGHCFELSAQFLIEANNPTALLVHGTITDNMFGTGNTLGHAWVEIGDTVYDPVFGQTQPKIAYYALFGAKPERAYRYREALQLMGRHNTYGPWHDGCVSIVRTKARTVDGKELGPGTYKE